MKKSLKKKLKSALAVTFMLCLGFLLGIGFALIMETATGGEFSALSIIWILVLTFIAYFINVILHEAGHLVMGLATGYKFLSFRIMSLILIRGEDGKYKFGRFSIPGTLGQCLLIPPELDEKGHMPNILYNLGGIMMNLLIAIVSALIAFLTPISGYPKAFFLLLGLIGFLIALENGIPMGGIGINNDGANIVALKKNPRVVLALWRQLRINAYQTEGKLFQEMPAELFKMPAIEEMSDEIVSAEAVFVENLQMEKMEHEKTLMTLDFLLDTKEIKLMDFYTTVLEADRTLIKLLLGKDVKIDKFFRKVLKQYSVLPNVLVVRYAIARLVDKDQKEAEKIQREFDKKMKSYPFRSDRITLPKYMAEIDNKAEEL